MGYTERSSNRGAVHTLYRGGQNDGNPYAWRSHNEGKMRGLRSKWKMADEPVIIQNLEEQEVPLTTLLPGERAEIVALTHGSRRQHHFRILGLKEGKIIKLIAAQPAQGPLVIEVEGTQVAIGRGMARHILIKKL